MCYKFYDNAACREGKGLSMGNQSSQRFALYYFQRRYAKNQVTFEESTRSVRSYNGHLKHGDTWHLRKHIYENLIFTRNGGEINEEKMA